MENLGINLGYLLVQIFMFAIVFVTLRAWVYKPILGLLEKRRQTIAQGLEDARIAAEARANAETESEKLLAEAQVKASEILRSTTERSQSLEKELRASAEAEITKMRESALADLEEERNRNLAELRGQIATLAIAATQKLIGESLDEKRQRSLLENFFSGVKSGKVTLLEGVAVSGKAAEVTSALPLTKEEQSFIEKDLAHKAGGKVEITFHVDPHILGGLVIKIGDQVIDGSVAGQLQSLHQTLV